MGKQRRISSYRGLILGLGALAATLGLAGPGLQAQNASVLLDAQGEIRDDAFDYMRMPLSDALGPAPVSLKSSRPQRDILIHRCPLRRLRSSGFV